MHSIQVDKVIPLMISSFYRVGFWHRGDKPTAKELRMKFFYSVYYPLFAVALVVGAITNEKLDKTIFLTQISMGVAVLAVKLWLLIWKQNEILDLLNRVCVFTIRNDDDFKNFSAKLRGFMKFVVAFAIATIASGILATIILFFLGRTLFLEIAFPFDWRNEDLAFWIASFFVFTGTGLAITVVIFSVIIWYLLLMCSLRYDVLGSELKRMGRMSEKSKVKMTQHQKHSKFFVDLKASIDVHLYLRKLTDELGSYFSKIFFIQFGSSGLSICGSIYSLAFKVGDNLLERLVLLLMLFYYVGDIFSITCFGNEIKLSSNRLSYCLFESDWYEQPQSTKKSIVIFSEYLKQPHELLIGKLYPLTLETFTKILNSAYSMFNILQSFEE